MEPDAPKQPNKALIIIVIVVLLAAATTAAVVLTNKKETPVDTTSQTDTTSPSSNTSSTTTTGSYKNGNYSADGNYQTPGGAEKITIKVTLEDGVINSVDLERDPTTREAEEYQGKFVSSYKDQVVGKKIDDVRLDRVAGSSLTPGGFNRALDQIKSDAKS